MYVVGIIYEGPSNVTYIPGRTPLPIELICNITGFPSWRVNGSSHLVDDIFAGELNGHNVSQSQTNLLIIVPENDTEYVCVSSVVGTTPVRSDPAFLYIAGEYACMYMYVCHVSLIVHAYTCAPIIPNLSSNLVNPTTILPWFHKVINICGNKV